MSGDVLISFAIFLSLIANLEATVRCDVEEVPSSCVYTITCKTYAGSARNPPCEDTLYVTFVIEDSNKDILTPGFFGSTNFDSRVREIKAKNCSWTQIGSYAFRYFARTVAIDLSGSHIRYVEKEAFRNLGALVSMNLSRNEIDTLYPESFLIQDSRSVNLNSLDLSYNALTELSGEILVQTPNLESLYLQYNKLVTIADDAFTTLRSLKVLNLRNNRLTLVNMTLVHLKTLTDLDLSCNFILQFTGYEINRLVALTNFNASHNALETIDSNCFNQSVYLKSLDLSYNKIKSDITNITFIRNKNIDYINLSNNLIKHIDQNSFRHVNISYLNLENNFISGDIEENSFSNLNNLKNLNLFSQNITAIKSLAFSNMQNFESLNLTKNNIKYIDETSFANNSLHILDISFNQISDMNFVKDNMLQLTELYINNNNLSVIPKSIFGNHTWLIKLDISMNNIIAIEAYSLPLTNLQYINLVGNKLQGPITKNVFSPSKFLRFLDLSNFHITSIDEMAFADLPLLARLNLSHNAIESIDPNNFIGVDNMFSLDLSHNALSTKNNNTFVMGKNLKALYLSNNSVSDVNIICSKSLTLEYLDLSQNTISDVSCIGANMFPKLTTLDLTQNKIKIFNNPQTNSLTSLLDLKLAYNQLEYIDLSYYKDLSVVDISNNNIGYINMSFFKNIPKLQVLDISYNKITVLPPGTFNDMKMLQLVNISSNLLTNLRFGSLRGLNKTKVLDLSRNSISSIDVDIFHECTDLEMLIVDYNLLKTLNVDRLTLLAHKLKTLSLGGNPISCQEIVRSVNSSNNAVQSVEVTSIDKIYHEDNVHGIRCGDVYITSTAMPHAKTDADRDLSPVVYVIITIVILLVIGMGVLYWYKRPTVHNINFNRDSRIRLHNSVELDNSEYQADLLN